MEEDVEMGFEAPLKRDHEVEVQGEEEAAKKRKIEFEAERRCAEVDKSDWWLDEVGDEEMYRDYYAWEAGQFREFWDSFFCGLYGSFEDESA
uniref:Uncharacterized protein n=1 Tax=Arundo donax TaxID=35708 RepID=A0A0A9F6N0_ARUDO